MIKYFTEAEDDIKMDVQVGPGSEVETKVEEDDSCERCSNPVDIAKKNPDTVPVGCCTNKETGVKEFYVDAADVAKLADLNEMTMLEALDEIIDVNEGSGMAPDNIVVVMSEGTKMYERNLERNGAACVHFNEAADETQESDINMDIQVGPNNDEVTVSEDPQEANPVDAVKRQYDSVVVAKAGDDFFVDVEDVQKCADLNCESTIDTLNGIIDVHEDFDMNTENFRVIFSETANLETVETMMESGVLMEASFKFLPRLAKNPEYKKYVDDLKEAEAMMRDKNIETKAGAMKALRICGKIAGIIINIQSVLAMPAILTIIGIIPYLCIRGVEWLYANGEEAAAKAEGKKVIKAMDEAIAKEENEEVKAKMQATRDKLAKKMAEVHPAFEDM